MKKFNCKSVQCLVWSSTTSLRLADTWTWVFRSQFQSLLLYWGYLGLEGSWCYSLPCQQSFPSLGSAFQLTRPFTGVSIYITKSNGEPRDTKAQWKSGIMGTWTIPIWRCVYESQSGIFCSFLPVTLTIIGICSVTVICWNSLPLPPAVTHLYWFITVYLRTAFYIVNVGVNCRSDRQTRCSGNLGLCRSKKHRSHPGGDEGTC